jgi:hypothetical protein
LTRAVAAATALSCSYVSPSLAAVGGPPAASAGVGIGSEVVTSAERAPNAANVSV